MFLGAFNHSLDDKNRITLPAKYRSRLAAGIVMTAGRDRFLVVYPKDEFELLAAQVGKLSVTAREAATLRRLVFGNGSDLTPDKLGRVVVPESLKEHAGITTDVVIVGTGNFMELWNPEEWKRAQEEVQNHAALDSAWANLGV